MTNLTGSRVPVIGASSGTGRQIGLQAAAALGGIDHLIYATAIDGLIRLAGAGEDTRADTLSTNIFGAEGRAIYLSASSAVSDPGRANYRFDRGLSGAIRIHTG